MGESGMVKKWNIRWEAVFLASVFVFYTAWAVIQPFNVAPDEQMRYQIVQYICEHGKLPHGGDPELRNEFWGISYGFNPVTTYILGAVFSRITAVFTQDETALLLAARMVNVLLGTGFAFFAMRLGGMLLRREAAVFFAAFACFLPGTAFLFSYINMDGLALFSSAWILYCWARTLKEGWTGKLCVQLAAATSVCALSYYNAYGYLLCSALFFSGSILLGQKKRWDFRQFFGKGFLILFLVALFAGWWFIRNAVLYDGDFLGMSTSTKYAEMYAVEGLKPSNRTTPERLGMSVKDMMLWVPGKWRHNWLMTVAVSFVGTFGRLDLFMPELWSKLYLLVLGVGFLGTALRVRRQFFVSRFLKIVERKKHPDGTTILVTVEKSRIWNKENLMRGMMLLAVVIPFLLLVYYAYCSDFQAQGRYLMPALLPVMYFVTLGYENWMERAVKKEEIREKIRRYFFSVGTAMAVLSGILVYLTVVLPAYTG